MTPNNSPAGEVSELDAKGLEAAYAAVDVLPLRDTEAPGSELDKLRRHEGARAAIAAYRRATPSIDGAGVRVKALEEAANLAETFDGPNHLFRDGDLPKGWAGCRRTIAAAIRALLDTSGPTESEPTPVAWVRQEGGRIVATAIPTTAVLTVFDWSYSDAFGQHYAGTPERAKYLASTGVELTPVHTIENGFAPRQADHDVAAPHGFEGSELRSRSDPACRVIPTRKPSITP